MFLNHRSRTLPPAPAGLSSLASCVGLWCARGVVKGPVLIIIPLLAGYYTDDVDCQLFLILQVQSLNLEIILHPKLITAVLAGAESSQSTCTTE